MPLEIRQLIREMSLANPLWGAPRIHGELLKLGIDIGQTSVAKYMARHRRPPSQGWKTFIRNHADGIASMDLFVVPTLSFRLLYGLLILCHGRRQILWLGVTAQPSAEWIARQLTEACGWEQTPKYIVRDRDSAYGEIFTRRLRAMGIRDRPTAPKSPWQNGHTERLIGSLRRECLDHVVVFGERHLRHILLLYMDYYNNARTHLSLNKGCAGPASCSGRWAYSLDTNSRRIAPSVCPDLISGRDRGCASAPPADTWRRPSSKSTTVERPKPAVRLCPFQQRSRAGRALIRAVRVLVFIGAARRTGSARRVGGGRRAGGRADRVA